MICNAFFMLGKMNDAIAHFQSPLHPNLKPLHELLLSGESGMGVAMKKDRPWFDAADSGATKTGPNCCGME